MIIDQSHKCPVNAIYDKYFPDNEDFLTWDDFGERKVDSEKFKAKVNANIKALQCVIKDIEKIEQKADKQ